MLVKEYPETTQPPRESQAAASMEIESGELRLPRLACDRLGRAWPSAFEKLGASSRDVSCFYQSSFMVAWRAFQKESVAHAK
jgi:hypothetical protein